VVQNNFIWDRAVPRSRSADNQKLTFTSQRAPLRLPPGDQPALEVIMAIEMLSYSQLGEPPELLTRGGTGFGQATALTPSEGEQWQSAGVCRPERDQPQADARPITGRSSLGHRFAQGQR
jgi:hypothetical protein